MLYLLKLFHFHPANLQIGARKLLSVKEITHKSPFLCVNRSPIRYGFRAGAKAIRYTVNMATPTRIQTKAERVSHFFGTWRTRGQMMICLSSELAWDQDPLWGKNVKNGVKRHKKNRQAKQAERWTGEGDIWPIWEWDQNLNSCHQDPPPFSPPQSIHLSFPPLPSPSNTMLKGAIPRASRFQPCRWGGGRDWEGAVEVARQYLFGVCWKASQLHNCPKTLVPWLKRYVSKYSETCINRTLSGNAVVSA